MVCNILPNAQTNENDQHIFELESRMDELNGELEEAKANLSNYIPSTLVIHNDEDQKAVSVDTNEIWGAENNVTLHDNTITKLVIYNGEDREFEVTGNYEIRSTDSNFRRGNVILKPGASVHIKDKIANGIITVIGKLRDGIYDHEILEGTILPQIIHYNPVTDNLDITLIGDQI